MLIIFISYRVNLENKGILIAPLVLIWRTDKFNSFYKKIASRGSRRFWKLFGNLSLFLSLQIFLVLPMILLLNIYYGIKDEPSPIFTINPINILSLETAVLIIPALVFSLVIHEIFHGIMATSEDVEVEKTGFMLIIAFVAAFVQIAKDKLIKKSRRARLRIISIGVIINLIFALILLPILSISSLLISPLYESSQGALILGVVPDSPAEAAKLERGDIIIGIKIIEFRTVTGYYSISSSDDLITNLRNIVPDDPFVIETLNGDISITGTEPPEDSNLITGSYIGVHIYDYTPSKNKFLSKFLPYWIEMEILWLININLILGLFNLLPLPFSDGGKLLDTLLEGISNNKRIVTLRISYLLSGILLVTNIIASL